MTYAISVPTPFTDITELAESFASRVDEERLMLPHYEHIPEGEWVQFSVTFADGSPALAGIGRCTNAVDNGEDRAPEHRFDVVMDALQLDEMGQIYFERILMVRAAQMGEEPSTGEVQVPDELDAGAYAQPAQVEDVVSFDHGQGYEDAGAAAYEEPAYPPEDEQTYDAPQEAVYEAHGVEAFSEPAPEEAYGASDVPAYTSPAYDDDASAPPLAPSGAGAPSRARGERLTPPVHAIYELPPPAAPGELPSPHANGASLTRRLIEPTWSPVPMERPDPSPSTGLFQYGDSGLPQPAEPPRPHIDPSLRVVRAPRPGDPLAAPMMRSAFSGGAAAAVAHQEEGAYEQAYGEEAAYAEDAAYAEAREDAYPAEYDAEGETRQVDIGGEDFGADTMQVDLGEDDEY